MRDDEDHHSAELFPIPRKVRLSAEDLVARHQRLPRLDAAQFRQEADDLFGSAERVNDDDGSSGA